MKQVGKYSYVAESPAEWEQAKAYAAKMAAAAKAFDAEFLNKK